MYISCSEVGNSQFLLDLDAAQQCTSSKHCSARSVQLDLLSVELSRKKEASVKERAEDSAGSKTSNNNNK